MTTTNHPVIPEEIRTKIESAYPLTPNPTGDRHIKVFNMAQEESRINAGFGYSLALKELEDQAKRIKELENEVFKLTQYNNDLGIEILNLRQKGE